MFQVVSLDVKEFINKVDPVFWETINILTNSRCDKQLHPSHIKDLPRVFILSDIMYCMDNQASSPLIADMMDGYGGSTEPTKLVKSGKQSHSQRAS